MTTLYAFPGNGQGGQIGVPYAELTPGGKGFFGTTFLSVNGGGAIFEFDISTNHDHLSRTNLSDSPTGSTRPLLLLDDYLYGSSGNMCSS